MGMGMDGIEIALRLDYETHNGGLGLSTRSTRAVELGYSHYGQWQCLKQVRYLSSA